MSKSNNGSKLDHGTLEDHRPLADNELDVTGGTTDAATPKLYEAACKGTHLPEVTIQLWR
jgi:type VI protein secretion system component Hcp